MLQLPSVDELGQPSAWGPLDLRQRGHQSCQDLEITHLKLGQEEEPM